jgi:hypothetical protein
MGQAGLPLRHPGLIDAVPIADQDAIPVVDERQERLFGAARVDTIEGGLWRGHAPKPLERSMAKPGGGIDVIDWGVASDVGNRLLVGLDGQGDTVEDFLDGSQTDGEAEYRGTERLHEGAAGALNTGHFAHQGAEPRAVSGVVLEW